MSFQAFDTDKNGFLDRDELVAAFKTVFPNHVDKVTPEKLQAYIDEFGKTKAGSLNEAEFTAALGAIKAKLGV